MNDVPLLIAGTAWSGAPLVATAVAEATWRELRDGALPLALRGEFEASLARLRSRCLSARVDASALPRAEQVLESAWRELTGARCVLQVADPLPGLPAIGALVGRMDADARLRAVIVTRDAVGSILAQLRLNPSRSAVEAACEWVALVELAEHLSRSIGARCVELQHQAVLADPAAAAREAAAALALEGEEASRLAGSLASHVAQLPVEERDVSLPRLAELGFATPELVIIEQLCRPHMTRRGEEVRRLSGIRQRPLRIEDLARNGARLRGLEADFDVPGRRGMRLVKATEAGDAGIFGLHTLSLGGRRRLGGNLVALPEADGPVSVRLAVLSSLGRTPLAVAQHVVAPGQRVEVSAALPAVPELVDLIITIESETPASGRLAGLELDRLSFSA